MIPPGQIIISLSIEILQINSNNSIGYLEYISDNEIITL